MWRMRWGFGRDDYRVDPGLYRLGEPDSGSPVLVTANYKFTVDVVRRDTVGVDAWLLVLDTKGINVWCAAGKRTFGTGELIRRIMQSPLPLVAETQTVIVPQLGAPGIASHEVRRATGYRVVYGPIRAADIGAFLDAGMKATDEMRAVTFTMRERLELTPVEVLGSIRGWRALVPIGLFAAASILYVVRAAIWDVPASAGNAAAWGLLAAVFYVVGVLAGGFAVPLLLPWVPGRRFALKGALAGAVFAAPLGAYVLLTYGMLRGGSEPAASLYALPALAGIVGAAAVSSYVAMNFTGSTPYTSPSGVEQELRRWIPVQIVMAGTSVALWAAGILWGVVR
ncbi:MAG: hypothetical protein HY876_09455 [Coriobacteriales bacterium]|nr:hypothetical protein [Coriobacteriales bacterium]